MRHTDNMFIGSLQVSMLKRSLDESLPIRAMMYPQILPCREVELRRAKVRTVVQLLPHPVQVVFDELTPI